jgi:hypothetical protein
MASPRGAQDAFGSVGEDLCAEDDVFLFGILGPVMAYAA